MGLYKLGRGIARRIWGNGRLLKLEPGLRRILKVWYMGKRHACPCCHARLRRFLTDRRLCPGCGSGSRHRLQWLFLENEYGLFGQDERILDIAPWRYFQRICTQQTTLRYHSMDLASRWAMERGDITALPYREGAFQLILCSHVLEHIPDDLAAMEELYRVLAPGGSLVILVPPLLEQTFEDPTATSAADRERVYGRSDHVRIYGRDIEGRLGRAGFRVELIPFAEHYGKPDLVRYGLDPKEILILGKKP